ncbi:restriction endonuclease subunit S [Mycoplasma zalophi]|nr:restriction endonuclease subunit S [Mycoplasma zalophi]
MFNISKNKIKYKKSNVKSIAHVKTGKKDANFSTNNGKYKFFTCSNSTLLCNEFSFDNSSILIAGNGDFNVKHYTGKFNAYQRTYVLTPKYKYYTLLYLSCVYRMNSFKYSSTGSIVKFISKNDIDNIPVFIPEDENILNTLNSFIKVIEKNNIENDEFIKLKDFLLPLLINGQVTIED